MEEIAIKAEGLSKFYKLGKEHKVPSGLYKKLTYFLFSPFDWLRAQLTTTKDEELFWALKDVSFEIKKGEIVGFIGHNGAGKSTLLKLLSRITDPSSGYAKVNGTLASLLEVGTGMHPELTGRENIYMNGTVLGMSKKEIDAAFNDIVGFAGVERFLDTAVKRYSSGMKVRLGFAIAAHLSPDILIVDEVLSVGDASFREKCLNKMNEVSSQGRTVLFVSHNLAALSNLCSRAYLMESGRIIQSGSPQEIISTYMSKTVSQGTKSLLEVDSRKGDGIIRFEDVEFNNISYRETPTIATGENCVVAFKMKVNESAKYDSKSSVDVRITFYNSNGQNLFTCSSEATGVKLNLEDLSNRLEMNIDKLPLTEGNYSYNLFVTLGGQITDWIQKAGTISVVSGDYFGSGYINGHSEGLIVDNSWKVK